MGIGPTQHGLEGRPLTLRIPAQSLQWESNPRLVLTKDVLYLRAMEANNSSVNRIELATKFYLLTNT